MEWEVITNERSSLNEYRLMDHDECKVVIKYNPLHQSARLTSGNDHRLFFIETTGGKTVFKNEYGMEIGNLVQDKFHPTEGTLLLETKKYLYQIQGNSVPELAIYESSVVKKVATCSIPGSQGNFQNNFSASIRANINCFLLGLCWYLFLPLSKQNVLQYAAVGF
jgi:hypothetical protein